MRINRGAFLVAAGIIILSLLAAGCGRGASDEDAVRAVIEDMADAASIKDIARLRGHISKDYKDPAGNDYNALRGFIALQFLRGDNITVFLRRQVIEVEGDKAYATVRAVISTGDKVESVTDIIPESTGGFAFDFTFTRDGSDWLLSSAVWDQVGVAEAL